MAYFARILECVRISALPLLRCEKYCASQIPSQTGQGDILHQCVHWPRQRKSDCVGYLCGTHHFVARPITFDVLPDVSLGRCGVYVDDANFAIT